MKSKFTFLITTFWIFTIVVSVSAQSNSFIIKGSVVDEYQVGIPYVAVAIPSKYVGTATTEDGDFQLALTKEHLTDSLEISSIGYKSFKIKVKDYVDSNISKIVLKEDIAVLSTVNILKPSQYVKNAIKNLKKTTLNKPHQLDILYRRFSVEDGKARFFVEHYLKAIDRGPATESFDDINVVQGRKSADYRFVKAKQQHHSVNIMNWRNAIRSRDGFNKYKWSKVGDTSYDGEDVIIIEGKRWKETLRLYIGMDYYAIYKVENTALNSVYIYKKNIDGRLYLSYHNREWKYKSKLTPEMQKISGKKKAFVNTAYRHEMFVLGLETNRKKIEYSGNAIIKQDIGDINVPYNVNFWNKFIAPPETKFYKKSVKELESNFGVPIKKQFKLVNK